jgi:hypothetical protein
MTLCAQRLEVLGGISPPYLTMNNQAYLTEIETYQPLHP